MSLLLRDEKYESMDPISQMVEPFVSPALGVIISMGDECYIDAAKIADFISNDWRNTKPSTISLSSGVSSSLHIKDLISFVPFLSESLSKLDDTHQKFILSNIKFSLSSESIRFARGETTDINEKIRLFVPPKAQDQSYIKSFFIQELRDSICGCSANKEAIKTIIEGLSLDPVIARGRAGNSLYTLSAEIATLIASDKWRIRSSTVLCEMSRSLTKVLDSAPGWGAELASLVHLKIMTHANTPIYSFTRIEE
jgi:hypothetical protein